MFFLTTKKVNMDHFDLRVSENARRKTESKSSLSSSPNNRKRQLGGMFWGQLGAMFWGSCGPCFGAAGGHVFVVVVARRLIEGLCYR